MENKNNSEQLIEMAKEKLRWFTLEATEEEFDEEAIDALVNLISTLEGKKKEKEQVTEKDLEHFIKYCEIRMSDDSDNVKIHEKTRDFTKKRFRAKHLAIAVTAASILIIFMIGSSMETANAGGNQGFFQWLEQSTDGFFAITSPDGLGVESEYGIEIYDGVEQVPEEYQNYLIDTNDFELLKEYQAGAINIRSGKTVNKISREFWAKESEEKIMIGVVVYDEQMMFVKEAYEDYKLQYTNTIDEYSQNIFSKENDIGETEYFVCFCIGRSKYFVQGVDNIEFLEELSEEYLHKVLN